MPKTRKELNQKAEFSRRLNEALDESPLHIPAKGDGRQTVVAKLFGVGQKAARKWLEGEGFPELEKAIEIAIRLSITVEWLLTGRGEKRVSDKSDVFLAELLNTWFSMPSPTRTELLSYGKFLLNKSKEQPVVIQQPDIEIEHQSKKSH